MLKKLLAVASSIAVSGVFLVAAPPARAVSTITQVTPQPASRCAGATLTVNGTGLTGSNGFALVTNGSLVFQGPLRGGGTDTQVSLSWPTTAPAGTHRLQIGIAPNTVLAETDIVIANDDCTPPPAPPALSSVSPQTLSPCESTRVTVNGTNLQNVVAAGLADSIAVVGSGITKVPGTALTVSSTGVSFDSPLVGFRGPRVVYLDLAGGGSASIGVNLDGDCPSVPFPPAPLQPTTFAACPGTTLTVTAPGVSTATGAGVFLSPSQVYPGTDLQITATGLTFRSPSLPFTGQAGVYISYPGGSFTTFQALIDGAPCSAPGGITGIATYRGAAASSVAITATPTTGGQPPVTTTTGPDGSFTFNNLQNGSYRLTLAVPGLPGVTVDAAATVQVNGAVVNTAPVFEPGIVTGTVTRVGGAPLGSDLPVRLTVGTTLIASTRTTPTGDFRFVGVPVGSYEVVVTDATGDQSAAPVTVTAQAPDATTTFLLPVLPPTITGSGTVIAPADKTPVLAVCRGSFVQFGGCSDGSPFWKLIFPNDGSWATEFNGSAGTYNIAAGFLQGGPGTPNTSLSLAPGATFQCAIDLVNLTPPRCGVPNLDADNNNDGQPDADQTGTVATVVDFSGGTPELVTVALPSGTGATLSNVALVQAPAAPPLAAGETAQTPLAFTVDGLTTPTVEVELFLPSPANKFLKWTGTSWVDVTSLARFSADGKKATITLTDNGLGDLDSRIGVIRDPILPVLRPITFSGFRSPVTDGRNVARAGRTVPIKWRLTGPSGEAIGPAETSIGMTFAPSPCSSEQPTTLPTASTTDASGLQYLGNGEYQFNWKTISSWRGGCRLFTLFVGGNVVGTIDFEFR